MRGRQYWIFYGLATALIVFYAILSIRQGDFLVPGVNWPPAR